MKQIIARKKQMTSEKKPKYATRKLSIGLVSCLLGFWILVTPQQVKASEISPIPTEEKESANLEELTTILDKDTELKEENPVTPTSENGEEVTNDLLEENQSLKQNAELPTSKNESDEEVIEDEKTEEKLSDLLDVKLKESLEFKEKIKIEDLIENISDLEGAKYEWTIEPNSQSLNGTFKVTYKDNSSELVDVTFANAAEAALYENRAAEGESEPSTTNKPEGTIVSSETEVKENWESTSSDEDYWNLSENQRLVRVGESDPIDTVDINYDGYFLDSEGNTNLRLVYKEMSTVVSAVWHNAVFKIDSDLEDKIDWEKSYAVSKDGNKFTFTDLGGYKALKVDDKLNRSGQINNLPINLVLKDGNTIESLGKNNYSIQMRFVDNKGEMVYAYAPKGSPLDYSTYTRKTAIALADGIRSEFLKGPQADSDQNALQSQFMTEFISNPETTDENLAILRTQYESLDDVGLTANKNTISSKSLEDKPQGFTQVFDARLVEFFKEDENGSIAKVYLADADKKPNNIEDAIYIKKSDINYSEDGKIAYIVIAEENFTKDGVKTVRVDRLRGTVYNNSLYFTTVDYNVDKSKFQDILTTEKNQEKFSLMTGFLETNPVGWNIFEENKDTESVISPGQKFIIDVSGIAKDDTQDIMVQIGDKDTALIRTMQGYYVKGKNLDVGTSSIDSIEEVAAGIYEITLREGATLKAGEAIRVYLPDNNAIEGPVSFIEQNNGSERNEGAATLEINNNRNIDLHIYRKDKGSFKLIYTPKGSSETKTITFTKGGTWKDDDEDDLFNSANRAVLPTGGNFEIDVDKLEAGTDIIVEAYNEDGVKEENLTSYIKYTPLTKSDERYEKMAWVDHTDNLSIVSVNKSIYLPYLEAFTNNTYESAFNDEEIIYNENAFNDQFNNQVDANDFNDPTNYILGFTKYDGGNIRMRYYAPDGKVYVATAVAASNEYDGDGNIVGEDLSKLVVVDGQEYKVFPYRISLDDLRELGVGEGEALNLNLLKDMRFYTNASDGSSLASDWLETRVKARVLFDATEGAFTDGSQTTSKVVPDNVLFRDQAGYMANGFEGTGVVEGTGDGFAENPTAAGKTFLGWVTEEGKNQLGSTTVKASAFDALDSSYKFTSETPVEQHQKVYAIYSDEILITFNANGGKYEDGTSTKSDNIEDGINAPSPSQEGKEFLGWASTPDAKAAEDGILDNVTESKTVYAVWGEKANKEKDIYTPEVSPVTKEGTAVTEADITGAITVPGYPEDAEEKPVITIDEGQTLPDGTEAGEYKITATVTYPDGTSEQVEVTVTITEKATAKEALEAEVAKADEVKAGDSYTNASEEKKQAY
ncbi:Rib/alpha-like domain-containing protein, partial [Anaerococcus sp. AGMB09787]|uniref:Rib/alpha-like domain-containing protein n=1 Tax=Anaerococcus sp. AGMB09787 TaxID=2922869 RepID=UPI001FAFD9AE